MKKESESQVDGLNTYKHIVKLRKQIKFFLAIAKKKVFKFLFNNKIIIDKRCLQTFNIYISHKTIEISCIFIVLVYNLTHLTAGNFFALGLS